MKVFMQFRKNVNYMAYISDCFIEICNTHTITFVYQTHFFSQFTFELHLAWNVFDWLLWVWGPRVMMVNIATIFAPVIIAISSARKEALIARKLLQYTTLSKRLQHRTLSGIKTEVLSLSDVLDCVSIHCAGQKQHSNPDFLTKSIDNTLPTCVDIANEYLQAYNTGAGVKNHVFCSLNQCKFAGYTMLLFAFVLSNKHFRNKRKSFFTKN